MDHAWTPHRVQTMLHGSGLACRQDIYCEVLAAIHAGHQCDCTGSMHKCEEEIVNPNTNPGVLLARSARATSSSALTHICMSETRKRGSADDEETLFAYGFTINAV